MAKPSKPKRRAAAAAATRMADADGRAKKGGRDTKDPTMIKQLHLVSVGQAAVLVVAIAVGATFAFGGNTQPRLDAELAADAAAQLGSCKSDFGRKAGGQFVIETRTQELLHAMREWERASGPSPVLKAIQQWERTQPGGQSSQPTTADEFEAVFSRDGLAVRARDSLCQALDEYITKTRSAPSPETR